MNIGKLKKAFVHEDLDGHMVFDPKTEELLYYVRGEQVEGDDFWGNHPDRIDALMEIVIMCFPRDKEAS